MTLGTRLIGGPRMPEICLACGKAVKVMCQQGTGYCCQNHQGKLSLEGLLYRTVGVERDS